MKTTHQEHIIPRPASEMRRRREALRLLLLDEVPMVTAYQKIKNSWKKALPKLEEADFTAAEEIYLRCEKTQSFSPFVAHLTKKIDGESSDITSATQKLKTFFFGAATGAPAPVESSPAPKTHFLTLEECFERLNQTFQNLNNKIEMNTLSQNELYQRGLDDDVLAEIQKKFSHKVEAGEIGNIPEQSVLKKMCSILGIDFDNLKQVDVPPSTNEKLGRRRILRRWQLNEEIIITTQAEMEILEGKNKEMINLFKLIYGCEDSRQFSIPLVFNKFYVDVALEKLDLPLEEELEMKQKSAKRLSELEVQQQQEHKREESLEERLARLRAMSKQPM